VLSDTLTAGWAVPLRGSAASAPEGTSIDAFLRVIRAAEDRLPQHERLDTRLMISRLRKLFYGGRGWDEHLERALAEPGARLTIALLDVDGLKTLNDSQGHAAGDALLVGAAQSWRRLLGPADVLARNGGDEFAVCFAGQTEDDVATTCARLRSSLPGGHTCSVGCAAARPGDTAHTLSRRADVRLYEDKRTRVRVVGPRYAAS